MLGKLLKHDFIATWKVTVAIDAIVVLLGILTALAIKTMPHLEDSLGMSLFVFSFIGLFYVGIIAANIVTIIYLVMRYYKNLYTSEGYLTFTLPVKTDMIIHSKVITGSVWMFLCYFATCLSLIIAGSSFISSMEVTGEEIRRGLEEIAEFMGFAESGTVAVIILTVIIMPIAGVLSMYFCVSIGQLWQNHKVLGTVLCVIGLYVVNQIFSQAAFIGSGFMRVMSASAVDIDATFGLIYRNILLITSILTLIEAVVYYVVCILVARKKINLD